MTESVQYWVNGLLVAILYLVSRPAPIQVTSPAKTIAPEGTEAIWERSTDFILPS